MANDFKIKKIIANLPDPLEANTIYIVRSGNGYKMFVSDVTGTVAHKVDDKDITDIIDKLKSRTLNFHNILSFSTIKLDSELQVGEMGTNSNLKSYIDYIPEEIHIEDMVFKQDVAYRYMTNFTLTNKGTAQTITLTLASYDSQDRLLVDTINLDDYQDGEEYFITKDFTSNGLYNYIEIAITNVGTTIVDFKNMGAYEYNPSIDYQLFDNALPMTYMGVIQTVLTMQSSIDAVDGKINQANAQLRNSGVNCFYTEFVNPTERCDYSNYAFSGLPFEIVDSLEFGIGAWKFDLTTATSASTLTFNPSGGTSPRIALQRGKYLFSFYAKTSANLHKIKINLKTSFGTTIFIGEFDITIGLLRYDMMVELPDAIYSLEILVDSAGATDNNGKTLTIERMMIETLTYQGEPDEFFKPIPSPFSDGLRDMRNHCLQSIASKWVNIETIGVIDTTYIEPSPIGGIPTLQFMIKDCVLYMRGAIKIKSDVQVDSNTTLFTITDPKYKPVNIGVDRFITVIPQYFDNTSTLYFGIVYDASGNCCFRTTGGNIDMAMREISIPFVRTTMGIVNS